MTTRGQIRTADGTPVRRAYVRHSDIPFIGVRTYMTDDDGWVTIDSDGNLFTGEVEVQVFAQNPVVRLLDGGFIPIPLVVLQTVKFRDGDRVDIANQSVYFDLLERFKDIYDRGLREFEPWDAEFPLDDEMDGLPRIEVSFPDLMPQPLAFVEPKSLATTYPLMHLKDGSSAAAGLQLPPMSTVAHELAHALHFAKLPTSLREEVQNRYLIFLLTHLTDPTHSFTKRTVPLVAYLEAFGVFGNRYFRSFDSALSPSERHRAFFADAMNSGEETVRGGETEGAVFAALFVDYARTPDIGLDFVVRTYVESQATTIYEYADAIREQHGRTSHRYTALTGNASRWGISHPSFANSLDGQTADQGPAIARKDGVTFIAWVENGRIFALPSADGVAFSASDRISVARGSASAPALCVFGDRMVAAWINADNDRLIIARSYDGRDWPQVDQVELPVTSPSAPALAVLRDELYVAWRGDDDHLNVMHSADGIAWGNRQTLADTSTAGPALAAVNVNPLRRVVDRPSFDLPLRPGIGGFTVIDYFRLRGQPRLMIAWRGVGNDRLNIMLIADGAPSGKVTLDDTTRSRPGLHAHGRRAFLTWQGVGNRMVNVLTSDDAETWNDKVTLPERCIDGPAIGPFTTHLAALAWTAADSPNQLVTLPFRAAP